MPRVSIPPPSGSRHPEPKSMPCRRKRGTGRAHPFNIITLLLSKLCFSIRKNLPITAKIILGETVTRFFRRTNARSAVLIAISTLSPAVPMTAWSQEATKPAAADQGLEEVVVTGSRIERTGFDAPTPTTTLDNAEIQRAAAPNIGQLVNELPVFQQTNTPASTTVSSQYAGQNNLNLRGLGAQETLVLVDGRRFVPSTSGGLVDTNVIPSSLIDRLEVVTGGASAAYGSDAVAGGGNIILKKDLNGFSGDFQPGI